MEKIGLILIQARKEAKGRHHRSLPQKKKIVSEKRERGAGRIFLKRRRRRKSALTQILSCPTDE